MQGSKCSKILSSCNLFLDDLKAQLFYHFKKLHPELTLLKPLFRIQKKNKCNANDERTRVIFYFIPDTPWHIWALLILTSTLLPILASTLFHRSLSWLLVLLFLTHGLVEINKSRIIYRDSIKLRMATKLWLRSPVRTELKYKVYLSIPFVIVGICTSLALFHTDKPIYIYNSGIVFFGTLSFLYFLYSVWVQFRNASQLTNLTRIFDSEYAKNVPEKSKRILDDFFSDHSLSSLSWRSRDDFYQVFYRIGLYTQFFSSKSNSISRIRASFITILFGPSSFSLFILILLPYLTPIVFEDGDVKIPALVYPLMIITWSSWSIVYYYLLGNRYVESLFGYKLKSQLFRLHGANSIFTEKLPHRGSEQDVSLYFRGNGGYIVNTIIIGIVPAYLTYVSVVTSC